MKKTSLIVLVVGLFLIVPAVTSAFTLKADNSYFLGEDEVIDDNVYTVGQSVVIKGIIKGDLICAGQNISIDGTVEGSVYCAGQTVNLNGKVGGSARLVGQTVSMAGSVERNVFAFGSFLNAVNSSSVGGDMFLAGLMADVQGKVGRDLHGALSQLFFSGEVGRNIKFRLDERSPEDLAPLNQDFKPLVIAPGARVGGEISYSAGIRSQIDESVEAPGGVHYHKPTDMKHTNFAYAWSGLIALFSSLVVGMVIVSLWGRQIKEISKIMLAKTGASFAWGSLILIAAPIVAIVLIFTLIGIPLALILFALWMIFIYLSSIITAVMIGQALLKRAWIKKQDSLIWAMIIGVIIVSFLASLPFLGWLFGLLATLWGLGGMWLYARREK